MVSDYFLYRQGLKSGSQAPASKPKPKGIAKRSKKLTEEMKKYVPEMLKFLEANPLCMAGLQGCNITSQVLHHQKGRIGKLLHDKDNFLALCNSCHEMVHHQDNLAKETGLSKSRLKKTA